MAENQKHDVENESLQEEATNTVEEARMVLPGIQAIFGFQLIAIFNQRFQELDSSLQKWHLAALVFVAVSIALIMAPAAYHRIAERGQVSRRLINLSSGLIEAAMFPLMIAISIEIYVVADVVTGNLGVSLTLALSLLIVFVGLWFIFPYRTRYRRGHTKDRSLH